jgi:hypothetical protein
MAEILSKAFTSSEIKVEVMLQDAEQIIGLIGRCGH